jgi:hypothetical protein
LLLFGSLLAQSPAEKPIKPGEPLCRGCGTQSFSIGEKHGQRFKLTVHFNEYRWGVTGTHWYIGFPVLVEYNASRLRASHVTYRKRQKTIEAWGDVSLEEASGKQERFDAAIFKINSGTLTLIKLLDTKERTTFPK